ncbi:carbohydrate binding domain-containing protein [Poriferisphaera sp. WC338]|uniref:carbohydrate binding domain-containing protein n=1 Tax=Poriferisphaera sp. WC338 TaxID=3425129 RepID=UPI003D81ADCE
MNIAKTTIFGAALACGIASTTSAAITANYGWEDGGTIMGEFQGPVSATNISNETRTGTGALRLTDATATGSGTARGYVARITGLQNGDTVNASFWAKDISGNGIRIWGKYISDASDINNYAGSAGGTNTYSDATWTELSKDWTFNAGTDRIGIVIEARIYSDPGDGAYIDDISVTVSNDNAIIEFPAAVPEPASIALLGLGGLLVARRRK